MNNNGGIPNFVHNKDIDWDAVRRASQGKTIHAKHGKLNLKKVAITGIVLSVLGTAGYYLGKSVYDRHTESKIIDEATEVVNDLITDYTIRTADNNGFYLNDQAIGNKLKDLLTTGEIDEVTAAYAVSTRLDDAYEKDEMNNIFERALGVDADTWAREHGYSGIDDPDFTKEAEMQILRNYEVENYKKEETDDYVVETTRVDNPEEQQSDELNTMFVDDNTNANVNDDAKGMGGR